MILIAFVTVKVVDGAVFTDILFIALNPDYTIKGIIRLTVLAPAVMSIKAIVADTVIMTCYSGCLLYIELSASVAVVDTVAAI